MTQPAPINPVREALLAALRNRAADGVALLNLNEATLHQNGIPDAEAIAYWVQTNSTAVTPPPATTTPDPSQGRAGSRDGIEGGREAYLRRHPTPAPGAATAGTQEAGRDAYARRHRGTNSGAVS